MTCGCVDRRLCLRVAAYRWNALKTYEAILNELGADIVCFQGELNAAAYLTHLGGRLSQLAG